MHRTIFKQGLFLLMGFLLTACGAYKNFADPNATQNAGPARINSLISQYADEYDVPEKLVHRVVRRESGYNPAARNKSYYGLMQIMPQTARTMGYQGSPQGLLDAETNLKYGVKYLRGAYLVANGSHENAVKWYSQGYYYQAKRMGLLEETGLRK